jgi:hypothetical protein
MAYRSFRGGSGRLDTHLDTPPSINRRHPDSCLALGGPVPRLLEWLRLPGDLVFIFLGALPILIAVGVGYLSLWSERPQARAPRPVRAA